jgi:uncharacterized membrane protein YgcG
MKSFALAFAVLLAAFARPAHAAERILAYDSQVQVNADGSLDVTERIHVRAEGGSIRRGIYRDFPTRYRDRHGNRLVVGFEAVEVLRDGKREPWFTENVANGVRINTGNDDFLPVPAEYAYTLRYRTTRQLGFFDDHDELYWNAIGTGWEFPIDAGSVEVRLPAPVPAARMKAEAYTGVQGAQEQGYRADIVAPGVARWQLAQPLAPGEGMTIVLSFPKGVVVEPTGSQRLIWLLKDNSGVLVALGGLIALWVFCFSRWRSVGRDPRRGVVIARYEPPEGWSPAGLRYLKHMGHDARCFSSDLLSLAVKGYLRIERTDGLLIDGWKLVRTRGRGEALTPSEGAVLALLPNAGDDIELKKSNATRLERVRTQQAAVLKKACEGPLFRHNAGSIGIAAAIAAAAMALAFVVSGGGILLLIGIAVLMVVTLVAFAFAVRTYTPEGRKLVDEIEGLKLYLSVAEKDELARMPAPDAEAAPRLDTERYQRLLPYAVALDVEDAWTKKFTAAAGAAAAAVATQQMAWYRGAGNGDLDSLTRSIGSAFTSQIASSSTPPGSSSGGGGGGSSGGGGGGGGGGGR